MPNRIMYRYATRWIDYEDSNMFYQLKDYAHRHFLDVVDTNNTLYFNATPAEVKEACRLHGITTAFIDVLTTTDLVPKQIIEVEHA